MILKAFSLARLFQLVAGADSVGAGKSQCRQPLGVTLVLWTLVVLVT